MRQVGPTGSACHGWLGDFEGVCQLPHDAIHLGGKADSYFLYDV